MPDKPPAAPGELDDDRTLYPYEVSDSDEEAGYLAKADGSLVPFELPMAQRYEQRGVLARGGMGVIERLYDRRLGRTVVRKTAHDGSRDFETRLAKEAWVLAQLDHPGIIQVLDAGSLDAGNGFYTMPLVHGQSLREVLKTTTASGESRSRLRHVRDACEAVGYAHGEGIVHRDLKPENIMVGSFGETRVMDWGLSRPVAGPAGDRWRKHFPKQQVALTQVGSVLGTPAYMSPEQARGETPGVTADVWSLGAILYEVVAGEPLFTGSDARAILVGVARGAGNSLSQLGPNVSPPLRTILQRALHDDPASRFANAKTLADELTRWLEGQEVESHQYTTAEQVGTLAVRWKLPLLAATASLTLGLLGMAVLAVKVSDESEAARTAQQAAEEAQRASEFGRRKGEKYLKHALVEQIRSAVSRDDRVRGEVLAAESLRLSFDPVSMGALLKWSGQPPPVRLTATTLPSDIRYATVSPDGNWLASFSGDHVGLWQTHPLKLMWRRPVGAVKTMAVTDAGQIIVQESRRSLVFEADGIGIEHPQPISGRIVRNPYSGVLYDYGQAMHYLRNSTQQKQEEVLITSCAQAVDFVSDGWWSACPDGLLRERANVIERFPLPTEVENDATLVISASEDAVYLGSLHSKVARLDVDTAKLLWIREFDQGGIRNIVRSESTDHIVVAFSKGNPVLLDESTGRTLLSLPPSTRVQSIAANAQGVVTVVGEREIIRYQLDATLRSVTWDTPSGVTDLEFSPDGAVLAVAAGTVLQIHQWPDGTLLERIVFTKVVKDLDFDGSGKLVVATSLPSLDVGAAVLRKNEDGDWMPYGNPAPVAARRMATVGSSGFVVAGYGSGGPRYYPSRSDGVVLAVEDVQGEASALENTSDAATTVWTASSGLWIMQDGHGAPRLIEGIPLAQSIAVDDLGSKVVLGTRETTMMIDLSSDTIAWELPTESHSPMDIAVDPSGSFTALGLLDGSVVIRDLSGGKVRVVIPAHNEKVGGVAFSRDGQTLATGGWDNKIHLWDLRPLQTPLSVQISDIEERWNLEPVAVLRELH